MNSDVDYKKEKRMSLPLNVSQDNRLTIAKQTYECVFEDWFNLQKIQTPFRLPNADFGEVKDFNLGSK